jgi:E-phenylitaconyl-CoA hydratase
VTVDFDVHEAVATVTINRPERRNAMDADTYRELSRCWVRARDDSTIRAVVITGAGDRAFSAGADLKSPVLAQNDLTDFWETQREPLLNRGIELFKPVVAAVNGACLGGGLTLLLATDLRLAAPTATFGLSEVKRGLLPGNGGTQRLLEQLPHPIAMQLLLTGEPVGVEFAERWGLINRVVTAETLLAEAQQLAARLAALPPLAVQACKELALRSRDMDRTSGLRLEQSMLRLLRSTHDAAEGRQAFAERRDPKFQGR